MMEENDRKDQSGVQSENRHLRTMVRQKLPTQSKKKS